jgi:hypothetical protein
MGKVERTVEQNEEGMSDQSSYERPAASDEAMPALDSL